jgi:tetratricopeptide (TPR) repeat protein
MMIVPMKSEGIAFGIAGIAFGLIAGWIIGTQQATVASPAAAPAAATAPAAGDQPRAAILDEARVTALKSVAERETANPAPRVELANLYFDAERFDDAITWYEDALKLNPKDVNISTDLGVSYYYTNQPDRAIAQLDQSLAIDPKHAKTLLNIGIVKAFGKQDLEGASKAWQQVIQLAPDSPEGQAAKRALDTFQSSHPGIGGAAQKPGT